MALTIGPGITVEGAFWYRGKCRLTALQIQQNYGALKDRFGL
jgi:hypothetical protein